MRGPDTASVALGSGFAAENAILSCRYCHLELQAADFHHDALEKVHSSRDKNFLGISAG